MCINFKWLTFSLEKYLVVGHEKKVVIFFVHLNLKSRGITQYCRENQVFLGQTRKNVLTLVLIVPWFPVIEIFVCAEPGVKSSICQWAMTSGSQWLDCEGFVIPYRSEAMIFGTFTGQKPQCNGFWWQDWLMIDRQLSLA